MVGLLNTASYDPKTKPNQMKQATWETVGWIKIVNHYNVNHQTMDDSIGQFSDVLVRHKEPKF